MPLGLAEVQVTRQNNSLSPTHTFGDDVQARTPSVPIGLSRVGVTGVEKVVRIREELFFARLSCFVDLSSGQKGAHMSRFEEVVNEAIGEVVLSESRFRAETLAQQIAELVRDRQGALRAEVTIAARYPEHKPAPVSGVETQEIYTLLGRAVAHERGTRRVVGVSATGMTACPCAQELVAGRASERLLADGFSREQIERILARVPVATHNQRGLGTLQIGCVEECDRRDRGVGAAGDRGVEHVLGDLRADEAHRRGGCGRKCACPSALRRGLRAGDARGRARALSGAGRRELRLGASGEPGDDPPAQRPRRAPCLLSELRAEIDAGAPTGHQTTLEAWLAAADVPLPPG